MLLIEKFQFDLQYHCNKSNIENMFHSIVLLHLPFFTWILYPEQKIKEKFVIKINFRFLSFFFQINTFKQKKHKQCKYFNNVHEGKRRRKQQLLFFKYFGSKVRTRKKNNEKEKQTKRISFKKCTFTNKQITQKQKKYIKQKT